MRIKITLDTKNLTLPINYYEIIQGIIYNNLPSDFATMVHDSDNYKYFNYSLLQGKYIVTSIPNTKDKLVTFLEYADLYISSIDSTFMELFIEEISYKGYLMFGNYVSKILKITDVTTNVYDDKITISTLSPITIHKTIDNKTLYYNPYQEEFFELLNNNISKKLELDNPNLLFTNIKDIKKVLCRYKKFIIEAYTFTCDIEGSPDVLQALFDVGLGDRNSQGFGMIKRDYKR